MNSENNSKQDVFNIDDTLDINELASLNDDISPEFIEQLQNKVAQNASEFTGRSVDSLTDDSSLFEEVQKQEARPTPRITLDESIDDNFIKKYKAKLNKQQVNLAVQSEEEAKKVQTNSEQTTENKMITEAKIAPETKTTTKNEAKAEIENKTEPTNNNLIQKKEIVTENAQKSIKTNNKPETNNEIKELSGGNIIEKPVKKEQVEYNETLDFADNNVKYSKYVIYIDPENTEFINSLTVKERKNLINRIIREQDDIAITKRRLCIVQTVLKHSIVAIITIAIAIPITYWVINASLEASIDNYRRSKTAFKTLYREKGKIKTKSSY